MKLPPENQRLKEVINHYCNDNETAFSKRIGVSQPRINRLFSLDKRSGNYPLPSFEIIQAVINMFIDVDAEWLLTGKGEMIKQEQPAAVPDTEIRALEKEIIQLQKEIIGLQRENKQLKEEAAMKSNKHTAPRPASGKLTGR